MVDSTKTAPKDFVKMCFNSDSALVNGLYTRKAMTDAQKIEKKHSQIESNSVVDGINCTWIKRRSNNDDSVEII